METNQEKTRRLVDFYNSTDSIVSQLPIEINGFIIESVDTYCGTCGKATLENDAHGIIAKPLHNTASFHTVCLCHKCKSITEAIFRYKKIGNNRLRTERLSKSGKWVSSEINMKPNLIERIKFLVKQLCGFNYESN